MDESPNTPRSAPKREQRARRRPHGSPSKSSRPDARKAEPGGAKKARRAAAAGPAQQTARLMAVTVTIDAESAEVVRIEGLDSTGARHELSDAEKATLMTEGRRDDRLAAVVERAFEAGLACVLGDADGETTEESPEDAELRHKLLAPLIERSAIGHLTERAALNRAMLGTLLQHSMR
jgi:hypothetical protein